MWAEVRAVRSRGYATVIGEGRPGVNGMAFPIPAAGPFPHGSLTVAGPEERLTNHRLAELLPELQAIMAELARQSVLFAAEYSPTAG